MLRITRDDVTYVDCVTSDNILRGPLRDLDPRQVGDRCGPGKISADLILQNLVFGGASTRNQNPGTAGKTIDRQATNNVLVTFDREAIRLVTSIYPVDNNSWLCRSIDLGSTLRVIQCGKR